jgi:hypothetical protein
MADESFACCRSSRSAQKTENKLLKWQVVMALAFFG